jgi:hypothetical protein
MSSSGVHGPFLTPTPLSQHGGLPMPPVSPTSQNDTPIPSYWLGLDLVKSPYVAGGAGQVEEEDSNGCCLRSHGL